MSAACIFCKIVKGVIPCRKVFETEKTLAFLDMGPLSKGHTLVIPKEHGEFLHEISDASLADLLPVAKKIVNALPGGPGQYNLLQNNGKLAHQEAGHVHFHIIPKPDATQGLIVGWPVNAKASEDASLDATLEEIKANIV